MFETLRNQLGHVFQRLTGSGHLTESHIDETMRDMRRVLLEADVALPVITAFLEKVKAQALGQEILTALTPAQTLIRIVRDEMAALLGGQAAELSFQTRPPAVMLLAGLQGAGKTTTAGKLAKWIEQEYQKKTLLVSVDVYRPAAREQLQILAEKLHIPYFDTELNQPLKIWEAALEHARKQGIEAIVLDTAGRLHIDTEMMAEIQALHTASQPIETLLVVDSMMGQDAAQVAARFSEILPITGLILTKIDGDTRGGAALSIRHITGAPIKFIGVGEGVDALERFYPTRMASRILGMGDMLGLIEQAEKKIDKKRAKQSAEKIKKGQFDLQDYLDQLLQFRKMGGIESILSKLPGMGKMGGMMDTRKMGRQIAIIRSMTMRERRFPALIKSSHKKRIAQGSGTNVQDINQLLKQFLGMQKMVQKLSRQGGMEKMMRAVQAMMGSGGNFLGR